MIDGHRWTAKCLCSAAVLAGSLVWSCDSSPPVNREFKGPREKVTIGVAQLPLSAPLIIAAEKGYFADEGLDVTIKPYSFGKLCLEAMFAGEVGLATVAQTPVVLNGFKRDDFSVIAEIAHNLDDSKLVARKDRIESGADLQGKTIGTPFGTTAHFFLDVFLSYHSVPRSSVVVLNIPAQDLPAALKDGRVDAISSFEPYAYKSLVLLQGAAVRLEKIELFRESFTLAGMKAFVRDHPQAPERVLRSLDRANAFIGGNRGEAIAILARKLQVDSTFLEAAWDGYVFDLSMDKSLLISLEDQARWAVANGLADKSRVPNFLDYLHTEALRAVKPEAVSVIH